MLPLSPPLPTGATWAPLTNTFTVTFDKPLQADPALNAANWGLNQGIIAQFIGNAAVATPPHVTGTMVPQIGGPPVGTIRYDPPPFDVIGQNGLPVAAFIIPFVLV